MTTATLESTSTARKLAKLAELRNQSGKRMFERIKLATEVYEDREWVETFDSIEEAEEHLQDEYLGDLCGAMSFGTLRWIVEVIPDEKEWIRLKYNVQKLHKAAKKIRPAPDDGKRSRAAATVKELESEREARKNVEWSLKRAQEDVASLRAENERLKEEVAMLKGQIKELREQLSKR